MAIGPDDALYVLTGTLVVVLDANGGQLRSFPVADQFSIAVGPDGDVWVGGTSVTKYSPTGTPLTSFGSTGSSPGQFIIAVRLAIS